MNLEDHRITNALSEYEWLVGNGESPERAAERTGLNLESAARRVQRKNKEDR